MYIFLKLLSSCCVKYNEEFGNKYLYYYYYWLNQAQMVLSSGIKVDWFDLIIPRWFHVLSMPAAQYCSTHGLPVLQLQPGLLPRPGRQPGGALHLPALRPAQPDAGPAAAQLPDPGLATAEGRGGTNWHRVQGGVHQLWAWGDLQPRLPNHLHHLHQSPGMEDFEKV